MQQETESKKSMALLTKILNLTKISLARMHTEYSVSHIQTTRFFSMTEYQPWAGKHNHFSHCDDFIHKFDSLAYFALINMMHKTRSTTN